MLAQGRQAGGEGVGGRVGHGAVEQRGVEPGAAQDPQQALGGAGAGQERVRDQERAPQAEARDDGAQFLGRAAADAQDPGQGQTGNHGQPLGGGRTVAPVRAGRSDSAVPAVCVQPPIAQRGCAEMQIGCADAPPTPPW